jgi:hypothetical protein
VTDSVRKVAEPSKPGSAVAQALSRTNVVHSLSSIRQSAIVGQASGAGGGEADHCRSVSLLLHCIHTSPTS